MYRPAELLVAEEDSERVLREIRDQLADEPAHFESAGVFQFVLRPDSEVHIPTTSRELRNLHDAANPAPGVAPNQMLTVQSHMKWSPGRPPTEAPELPTLPCPSPDLPGHGVRVGVVDTGVDDVTGWLSDRYMAAGNVAEVLDQAPPRPGLDFEAGHGTFITGIVLQRAPGATVVVRRIDDDRGCIDDLTASELIADLTSGENAVDILNLSFGGYSLDNTQMLGVARALERAWRRNPDLVVVAAAGNDGVDRFFWPAALKHVVAVGALTQDGSARAPFSNYGSWVDAWVPGEDVHSSFLDWTGDLDPPPYLEPGPVRSCRGTREASRPQVHRVGVPERHLVRGPPPRRHDRGEGRPG